MLDSREIRFRRTLQAAERGVIGLFEVSIPSGQSEQDLHLFRYAFSHDLKVSLRPILGFGQYLEKGEVSSARASEFHSKMMKAAQNLERQLDALSEYVRLCLRPARSESVDLAQLLPAVVEQQLARFRVGEECVQFADIAAMALADTGILKVVFSELISNALFFSPAQQAPRVRISCRRQGERVETLIEDSGLGIPSDCLALLGKPFQRFHSDAHLADGVGLGLARVGRGLASMQGQLRCSSTPGQGSLFLVSLRAA